MKPIRSLISFLAVAAGLLNAISAVAGEEHKHGKSGEKTAAAAKGQLVPVTEKDAAWAAKARASYPMNVCVASDEKFEGTVQPTEMIYREPGKPDRLIRFCCDGCGDDFMKDPAMHLAKLDAAAKKKAATKKP